MTHLPVAFLVALIWFTLLGIGHAQIKVVKKPAPQVGADEEVVYDHWVSSWGLRDDPPSEYPLGVSGHKTEAEAVAAAKAHIARSAGNGAFAVTHYLIEGEPSVRRKSVERVKQGMDLLSRLKEAKEDYDHAKKVEKGEASVWKAKERKLGDTLKEYKDMVAKSYNQAKEVKNTLVGGTSRLTEAKMNEVNALIKKYNGQIIDFEGVMGSSADLGYSPLSLVEMPKPAPTVDDIVGVWKGTSVQGLSRLGIDLAFREDGTVSNRAVNGQTGRGTWALDGDTVTITWSTGAKVSWRISAGQLGGSGTTSRGQPWSISFRKQ